MKSNKYFSVFFCIIFCVSFVFSLQSYSINRTVLNGKYNNSMALNIDKYTEYIIEYVGNKGTNPVKLTVENISTTINKPLLIVAQQQSQIVSWQIPYVVHSVQYNKVSHILCPSYNIHESNQTKPLEEKSSNPVVHIRAPAAESLFSFKIKAEIQQNFFIKSNHEIEAQVSINEPIYFYYRFSDASNSANESGAVFVQAMSIHGSCMILSIQNSTCPVFDLETKYDSYYQTMTRQAGIVVKKSIYPHGFYIVMVMKQNDAECYKRTPTFEKHPQKSITLKVTDTLSHEEHLTLAMSTIGLFGGIFAFSIIVGVAILVYIVRNNNENEHGPANTKLTGGVKDPQEENPKKPKSNYVWHVGIVSIFYAFPVLQLVLTYQGIFHDTGNADICYYNFLCAHPLGVIYDFNHVFSNIGYIILGVLFLIITFMKQILKRRTQRPDYGLHKPFGMYYALGLALIMEGVMSACYHVCPKASNYHFDTSFMYIMTVLMVVNVYESRHKTGDSNGYIVFSILAVVAAFNVISLVIGKKLYFWIIFGIMQFSFSLYLTWVLEKSLIEKSFQCRKITCDHACKFLKLN